MSQNKNILQYIKFNEAGLVPVIAQDSASGQVLMMAWMNKDAVLETLDSGEMCYFSRSRNKLWYKGETSGQQQNLEELIIDCDGDTLLAKVTQKGVACHTGRRSCFYKTIKNGDIEINQEVITPPQELYKND